MSHSTLEASISLIRTQEGVHGKQTIAIKQFSKGEIIFHIKGKLIQKPNMHSLQIDKDKHIELVEGSFLNHNCMPNGYFNFDDMTFRALRNIRKNEELTFNYNTTEFEMSHPFLCWCGNDCCYGFVRGYKYLVDFEKNALQYLIPAYLKNMI